MLNIEEIIEIADNHVFEHQGRHLNDLQRAILERTLQGRSYADIATEHHHSEKYIKDSASKLWKSLSQAVGKKVNKFNVKSTLGRCTFSSTNIFKGIQINSGNLFKESAPSPENDEIIHKKEKITSHLDLKDAPEIGNFYGRKVELLHFIASQNGSILLSELENSYQVYEPIVSSIQSLKRRFLVSTQQINAEVSLEISPVIRKFYHKLDYN